MNNFKQKNTKNKNKQKQKQKRGRIRKLKKKEKQRNTRKKKQKMQKNTQNIPRRAIKQNQPNTHFTFVFVVSLAILATANHRSYLRNNTISKQSRFLAENARKIKTSKNRSIVYSNYQKNTWVFFLMNENIGRSALFDY